MRNTIQQTTSVVCRKNSSGVKSTVHLIALILMLFVEVCLAQTGSITGFITNKSTGEPLISANIIIVDTQIGATTDLDGKYIVEDVPIGTYNVKYSTIGYRSLIKNRVVVKSGRPTVVNVELEQAPIIADELVVTPSYFAKVEDAPVSAYNIDYEEIAIQPGGLADAQRATQALPSVVTDTDTDNDIIVRGGNHGENLFIIDDVEIPNPNHLADEGTGGGPISAVYIDFIEDIDFIAGAFPAKYGNKASSVMNITLREGLRDKLHLKLDLGMAGVGGNVEGPLPGRDGSYMLSGHMFRITGTHKGK